jgi:hypothetical protein
MLHGGSPFAEADKSDSHSWREYYRKRLETESFSVFEAATARTHPEDYTPRIMASRIIEAPSVSEICARVKHLGYSVSKRVRLYGEDFDVVSDPFPDADGIAVRVTTKTDAKIRVLQIPATVLQSIKRAARSAA